MVPRSNTVPSACSVISTSIIHVLPSEPGTVTTLRGELGHAMLDLAVEQALGADVLAARGTVELGVGVDGGDGGDDAGGPVGGVEVGGRGRDGALTAHRRQVDRHQAQRLAGQPHSEGVKAVWLGDEQTGGQGLDAGLVDDAKVGRLVLVAKLLGDAVQRLAGPLDAQPVDRIVEFADDLAGRRLAGQPPGQPVGQPDICRDDCTYCGDQIPDPAEQCDDGNVDAGDGCNASCTLEYCGNGFVDPGEVCDDGNRRSGDGCSADCRSDETCGNGYLDRITGREFVWTVGLLFGGVAISLYNLYHILYKETLG